MKKSIIEKYKKLEGKYEALKKKYEFTKKLTLHRENIKRSFDDNYFLLIITLLGISSLIILKSQIAIEISIIAVILMLIHEIVGTKKGWWKYNGSRGYKIKGKVPAHLILTYFFSTILLMTYVMFRFGAI